MIRLRQPKKSKRNLEPTKYDVLKVYISDKEGYGRTKSLYFECAPPLSIPELAERIRKALS